MPEITLVTGGAGFVGSQLVGSLLRLGHTVVVYDSFRSASPAALPASENLVVVEGDTRDARRLRGLVAQFRPNRVCHLAALHVIPFCERHPDETRAVNIDGTRAVLDACREHPPAMVRNRSVWLVPRSAFRTAACNTAESSEVPGRLPVSSDTGRSSTVLRETKSSSRRGLGSSTP